MLSAVANFLFGTQPASVVGRPEEEAVDYEVNEAEDWLLVDVSDHETYDYDTMDDAEEEDVGGGEEELDALSSVPELLTSTSNSVMTITPITRNLPHLRACEDSWLVTSSDGVDDDEVYITEVDSDKRLRKLMDERIRFRSSFFSLLQSVRSIDFSTISCLEYSRVIMSSKGDRSTPTNGAKTKAVALTTPYPHKTKHNKQDKRVRHPAAISGAFINHQPPFVITKVELLEHVKQLKPTQQARERDIKKHMKKSRMDRQNKTCQFESSNKHKRRKDYQQRHSGANNNRKC